MKIPERRLVGVFRGIALLVVGAAGLLSILGTTSGGGSDPTGADACAGLDQQVKTGTVVRLDASCSELNDEAFEDDYLHLRWQIVGKPTGSNASLSAANVINPVFTADLDGLYRLRLRARSDSFSASSVDEVQITASTANSAPVAHAGYAFHVKVGDNPVLDGSRSADADDDLITYAWTLGPTTSSTLIGEDTPKPGFDTQIAGYYDFRLIVNDGALDSARSTVAVHVTSDRENACPDADAGPDQRVSTGTLVNLDGSDSRDADQDQLGYEWRMIYRPEGSNAELDAPINNIAPSFIADVDGAYVIKLKAQDADTNRGLISSCIEVKTDIRDTITVIASSGNSAPVADAGSDQVVDAGSTVQLNAAGSSDADADLLSYLWSFVSLPQSSAAMLSGSTTVNPTFVADVEGSYVVQLTVSDGVESDSDTLVVEVPGGSLGQTRPLADAGVDQVVTAGATVNLDGSGSSDPNGDSLTYNWTFIDWPGAPGGAAPLLNDSTSVTPNFIAVDSGTYVLSLVVNDGVEDSLADSVQITVQAAGACASPMNLLTSLPFIPGAGEVATIIQIDGSNLSVVGADIPASIDALQANSVGMSNPDQANFIALGPTWEEISRTHPNPISDTESPSFVVRQTVDNIYYKLDVDFTGDAGLLEVQIDALTGCNCGNDAGNCPS